MALPLAILSTPVRGDVTYTLQFDPGSSPEAQQVANSVAVAASFYNQHGSFNKHWNVYYNPGIPTAEASYDGYMGYGGTRNERVVFHEAAHTFGMGQHSNYFTLISGGVWGGQYGNQAQFDTYNTYGDGLHGDGHAIWPGGFNYDSEDGYIERHWHTRIMAGIRADMGLLSFTKEAGNELVHPGETAEFTVVSPMASSYQWYKNGSPLANGGDVSGATSATLSIANADATDEGSYHCAATGAGETLNSRPRQLWVDPAQALARLDLDGGVTDSSGNGNHGTAFGSPGYTTGMTGQAIDLDGADDYIDLPDAAALTKDFTVATWVNWDGGGSWQRIFDFGNDSYQNVFLSPSTSGGNLRLAFKDSVHGVNTEYQVNSTALPAGQWVHVAAILKGDYATLYVNGQPVGTTFGIPTELTDIQPTRNYIGKSQYPDPLFNGRIDDFRVYNHALDGAEIWDLWGQSANSAPVFSSSVVTLPDAGLSQAYTGQSLVSYASDADLDTLTFTKLDGPAWLSVASDGTLSGTPGAGDFGSNSFVVRVTDPSGASSDAEVRISVDYPATWVKLTGTVIGTPGSWGGNPALTKEAAFDGDLGTFYDAVNASGDWTGLDLGSAEQITLVKYAPRVGFAYRMVGGQFQGSNTADFSSGVVTLHTIGTQPVEGSLTEQLITDPGAYRYVRYIGPNDGYCNVSEIELYGPSEPDTTAPAAPTGLAATAGDGSVDLDWSDNGEPDLASYTVYRSTTSGSGYAPIATGIAASAYTDNAAVNGTTYYYVVTATDTSSNESAVSGEASATPEEVNNAPQFASSLLIKANATEASSYSGSIAGDASDPDTGDTLTFSKLSGPAWLSVAGDGTLGGTPGSGDVGTNQWTVKVTDAGGLSDTATLQVTVDALPGPVTYGANGETMVAGSIVSGSYASTLSSDNSYEQLQERESGGKPSNRYSYLEHVWTFDLGAGGAQAVLSVEAHHSANSEGDDFVFAYSTDGSNYTDAITVTKTADDNIAQTAALPGGLSGTVQIRVKDTDQSQGNRAKDSIYVDALGIEVTP